MHPLFNYQDYVDYLAHSSNLVRRWAFDAIEKRYPHRFTPQVARLIGDSDEHLACAAPKYLAEYGAMDYAPAILESFIKDEGNVPSKQRLLLRRYERLFRHDPDECHPWDIRQAFAMCLCLNGIV